MSCLEYLMKCVSMMLLLSINIFLALGGGLVLYVAIYMRHTGWIEVVQAYWSPINGLTTALICVTGVLISMAVMIGPVVTLCRWQVGMYYYSIFVLLMLLLFILVGVCAFLLWSMFSSWDDDMYPASTSETDIKGKFDEAYCYAQGVYICSEASIDDALSIFVPALNVTVLAQVGNSTSDVNAFCDNNLNKSTELASLCNKCSETREHPPFSSVLEWSNTKCPRVLSTLSWCGTFLLDESAANITTGTAPYFDCRSAFLDLVSNYSLYLAIGSVIVIVGSVAVLIMTRYLRCRDMSDVYEAF